MREVEKFRLDIVGLTSTHSKGSGTRAFSRGVGLSSTLELPLVRDAGQGWQYLLPPGLVPEFTPVDERVAFLHLRVWEGS